MATSLFRATTGLWPVAVFCLGGCLPEALPGWLIADPRLLVIEQTVVEAGPYSQPLELDPEGARRREGLPGDRVRLEAFIAGPDGLIELTEPPVWIRSAANYRAVGGVVPPCAADGLDGERSCRVDGDTLTLPPRPVDENGALSGGQTILVFASTSDEMDPEGCLDNFLRYTGVELFGCHIGQSELSYGPRYRLEELAGVEVVSPELDPDYALRSARLELTIHGEAGAREVMASSGDTVMVRPEETMDLRLGVADESELQLLAGDVPEVLRGDFFATAPVFNGLGRLLVSELAGTGHADPFYVYVDVGGYFMWVRFIPGETEEPSP